VPETWLVAPATWAVYGDPTVEVDLYLFREVNAAFILSLVTFAVGFVLYLARMHSRAARPRDRGNPLKFDPGWDRTLDGLKALAEWQTRILQSGVLQRYMVIIFVTLADGHGRDDLGQGCARARRCSTRRGIRRPSLQALGGAGLHHRGRASDRLSGSRMTAVAALGVVGIGVALIFIMFSAPDVAITQLLVETLTVVLVAVAMLKLPHLNLSREERRPGHAVLSLAVGRS
jgi:multicomponent Na+:H+ antiporter subunit A